MRHISGWNDFEGYCVNLLGLSKTIASGSQWHDIGDGVDRRHYSETDFALIIDAKFTTAASFTVNAKKLGQWVDRAMEAGKRFVMPIRLWPRGALGPRDYAVITLDDLAELLEKARVADEWKRITHCGGSEV